MLDRLCDRIAHRGPDKSATWYSTQYQLGLAFTRLSILDLSDAGMQPMFDKDKTVVVCLNGEIYNYKQIKNELELLGYQFNSTSDTEAIVYAYKHWGINFLHKLEGMFFIAIYDFSAECLYLVRDRMGVKPLYFSTQNGVLSFASEIKAFWEMPWMKRSLSSVAAYHYLTFMVAPAPYTIFKEVYKMPAGFYAKVDRSRDISFTEWYSPIKPLGASCKKQYEDENFCVENIRQLLFNSVKKRMVSDVPVGAFLSGGLDSSYIVALMSQMSSKVKTFTVAFSDGPEFNEFNYARIIAEQFDTEHHELLISEKDAFNFYEKMIYHLDEPLADCVCIPFYYVSKLARESGVTVAQVGEGADELFFGYNVYTEYKKLYERLWGPSQRVLPSSMRNVLHQVTKPFFSQKPFYSHLVSNWADGRNLFWGGALAFNEGQKKSFLLSDGCEIDPIVEKIYKGMRQEFDSFAIVDYHLSKLQEKQPESDFCNQMMYLEFKQRLPELLLMRADKMSMAVGLEAREPFLDHELVEFMFNVPAALRVKNNKTKYLLKRAAQGILPDVIVNRKKIGFAAPTFRWFNKGKYFPAYFQKISECSSESNKFMPATPSAVGNLKSGNKYASAVQKWVLQQLWATECGEDRGGL